MSEMKTKQQSIFDSLDEHGRRMTQSMWVLRHMLEFGSITPVEAMKEYGIMRLAARISDLEGQGFDIAHERVTGRNRYGDPVSYCSYRLHGTGVKTNGGV